MLIENIVEPTELFLMWKSQSNHRHKVGVLTPVCFSYLDLDSPEMVGALKDGFKGFPAFDMAKKTHANPLPVFMRRCPPADRRDFGVYLRAFSLNPDSPNVQNISDFGLLGYTGAYVHGNAFHLLNPFRDVDTKFEFVMQVAGFHHNACTTDDATQLVGQLLTAVKEPDNLKDPDAIKLCLNGRVFGYVQRYLNQSFANWIQDNRLESIVISRINGSVGHRYAYAFVRIRGLL